jgi:hypothetical protein
MRTECYTCGEVKSVEDFYPTATQCKGCLRAKREVYRRKLGLDVVRKRGREHAARYRAKLQRERGLAQTKELSHERRR